MSKYNNLDTFAPLRPAVRLIGDRPVRLGLHVRVARPSQPSPGSVRIGTQPVAVCLLALSIAVHQVMEPPHLFAVVLPVESDNPQLGRRVTDALRVKWHRHSAEPGSGARPTVVLSAAETEQLWPADESAGAATDPKGIGTRLAGAGVHVAVWGTLATTDGGFCLRVRAVEIQARPAVILDAAFRASGERAVALLADQVVAALAGRPTPSPAQADTGPEPPAGELINVNPGLEQGTSDRPLGWDRVDGLTTLWVHSPDTPERGRVLQMDTRILAVQASKWWSRWRDGAPASDAPGPAYSRPPHYDSVGAGAGVHYYSDYYPVKPHRQYRISADLKGPSRGSIGVPKVFVKGYGRVGSTNPVRREIWRTYLACRNPDNTWRHYWQRFQPAEGAEWLRVVLYAHWPPDVYYWDDVRLTIEPQTPASRPAGQAP